MKTKTTIIILSIIITSSIIFALTFELSSTEHYEIEITGLKDVYLVGEPYSFSYTITGYGYPCATRKITYPDENGDTEIVSMYVQCVANVPKEKFEIKHPEGAKILGNTGIKNPGNYGVSVSFEKSTSIEPNTTSGKEFHVVEKICNDQNPKDKAQCFTDAFNSCTSAYIELVLPTGEGDGIFVTGVVESWNDCKLRVYTDHSQDRYKGDTYEIRSICDLIILDGESITFQNCNNEDIPPLRFDKQYYLHKEKCEIYGGYWNFESNTCIDFSDDYDCETMGGELVDRAYEGEEPDYSKKSHSFVCEFIK